jgi:hypothetical protein
MASHFADRSSTRDDGAGLRLKKEVTATKVLLSAQVNATQLTSHTGKLIALRSATAMVVLVSDGACENTRSNSPG